jgi:hypothetical protein
MHRAFYLGLCPDYLRDSLVFRTPGDCIATASKRLSDFPLPDDLGWPPCMQIATFLPSMVARKKKILPRLATRLYDACYPRRYELNSPFLESMHSCHVALTHVVRIVHRDVVTCPGAWRNCRRDRRVPATQAHSLKFACHTQPHTIAPHHVVTTRARAGPYPSHVYGPEAHVDAPEAVVHGH